MNKLKLNGTQEFMGMEIPIIEGGFGENNRVITVKTIAEIHKMSIKEVNQSINRLINKGRLTECTDYINMLANENLKVTASDLGLITSNGQKNCFIISKRGYIKLVKYMDDEKSWDVMEQFVDEYFEMKTTLNSKMQKKSELLLQVYNGGIDSISAAKKLAQIEVEVATTPLIQKIKDDEPYTTFAKHVTEAHNSISIGDFAKIVDNEHINIGRNTLFAWLRDNRYLMVDNTPYQKYINNNYFVVIEATKRTSFGTKVFPKTLITPKGQLALVKKLRNRFGCVA